MRLPLAQASTNGASALRAEASPQEVVRWALERFHGNGRRLVVTTGFGMEGCVMIDLLAKAAMERGEAATVWYIDTGFLFSETHELRERLAARYPAVRFERVATDVSPERQAREFGAELWKTSPDACCAIRKVEPMRRLVREGARGEGHADAWMTAVSRSQGASRAGAAAVKWDAQFELVKLSPLAAWSRRHVWDYVREHDVPYNPLHERGYPSIGCTHCTSPVEGLPLGEYSRQGRWASTGKTECGLHIDPAGENI